MDIINDSALSFIALSFFGFLAGYGFLLSSILRDASYDYLHPLFKWIAVGASRTGCFALLLVGVCFLCFLWVFYSHHGLIPMLFLLSFYCLVALVFIALWASDRSHKLAREAQSRPVMGSTRGKGVIRKKDIHKVAQGDDFTFSNESSKPKIGMGKAFGSNRGSFHVSTGEK